jgi:hypothetical protein
MKKIDRVRWEIHIREAYNGFICNIGCGAAPMVFSDLSSMVAELKSFYNGNETDLSKQIEEDNKKNQTYCEVPAQLRPR